MTINSHKCPCCNGTGHKTYVAVAGPSVGMELKEPCELCSYTGMIYLEVSLKIFQRHHCKTVAELKAKLDRHYQEMRHHRREAVSIANYLERTNAK